MRTPIDIAKSEVCVLAGGASSEREVSLKTGAAVARALRADDGRGPARVREVEIRSDGRWVLDGEALPPEAALARVPAGVVWFVALHGGAGEDGTIQGLLSALGRAHTGSGVGASALCMNKSWTRAVLSSAGLAVAPALRVDAAEWRARSTAVLQRCHALGTSGFAVKPESGGSSVATFLVTDPAELADAIARVLATGDAALVEARIVGAEATCGVLGRPAGPLRVLTPVEIVPKPGRFFDYQEKYDAAGAAEHCPPLTLLRATTERIRTLAERAFLAAGCGGYARVDFMVPRDGHGGEGEPVVLEINTLPGMTDRSLLPLAAAEAGLAFRDLCLEILALASVPESR